MESLEAFFSHITGHEPIKKYLIRMAESNVVAHSLLFVGNGEAKSQLAEAFAKMLLSLSRLNQKTLSDSDINLHIYRPEGKIGMHSIDSLRRFNEEVHITPHEAKRKVFIIHHADRMLPYSANAWLKTFEEPPKWSVIILLANSPDAFLPTILSRCRIVRCPSSECLDVKQQEGVLREELVRILSKGRMASYGELMEAAASLSVQLETSRSAFEEEARSNIFKNTPEDLTSVQKQSIEKELDGLISMHAASNMNVLFDGVQSWYRDIHLLQVNGDPSYLLNPNYRSQLDQLVQSGLSLSLECVQEAVSQAKLAFERSTPVAHVLENLFLKLRLF